jgi:hypothetical protein
MKSSDSHEGLPRHLFAYLSGVVGSANRFTKGCTKFAGACHTLSHCSCWHKSLEEPWPLGEWAHEV